MWQLLLTHLHLNTSTLRSLSWSLSALQFLLLLVGLRLWYSSARMLSTFALQLTLQDSVRTMPHFTPKSSASSVTPELLTQTATRLASVYKFTPTRAAILCVVWFFVATGSLWTESQETTKYQFHDVTVEKVGDARFWLTEQGGVRHYVTLCRDYDLPPWQTGWTLIDASFVDETTCWSRNPNKGVGWHALRSEDGSPIIAGN
jgi:hypothetical protein